MELIGKGAEANLFLEDFEEVMYPSDIDKILIKHRIPKEYRVDELDKRLRDYRTTLESKLLSEAKKAGVPTPTVYRVDRVEMKIIMQYVEGEAVKTFLGELDPNSREELCKTIGRQIGRLHDFGIIHGDLTTSNMIRGKDGKIYFIDFGLGEYSSSIENRGTDIHLVHRTLSSSHFQIAEESFEAILKGYREGLGEEAEDVIRRVSEIEKRGRYVAKEDRK